MRFVDDAREVGAALRICAVERGDLLAELGDQLVVYGSLDQHVVRCDARLPGVDELAPRDATGRHGHVGMSTDDGRALSTQLQRDGCQVLGSGAHDHPRHASVAGVQDVVEPVGQQLRCLGNAALHNADGGIAQVADQLREHCVGVRCQFAGLADHGVACRDCGDHRQEQQLHRIVPRSNRTHHAHRLGNDVRGARLEGHRRRHLLGAHPLRHVGERVVDVADHEADLGPPCFQPWLAEVGSQRVEQLRLAVDHQLLDGAQRCSAPLDRPGAAGGIGVAGGGDDRRDLLERGGDGVHRVRLRRRFCVDISCRERLHLDLGGDRAHARLEAQ